MPLVALGFAVIAGVLVLAGYFVPVLSGVQRLLLGWVVIVAGAATVVGVLNLILIHGSRIQKRERGSAYSAILLVCLFAAFVFGLVLGPSHPQMRILVDAVIVPAEASLMALLAVSLLYAAVRLLRRRATPMTVVFLAIAVLMFVASATLPFGEIGALHSFAKPWIQHVLAMGGARGMLIGVALGTLMTGLRVLIGADRPYGGN